jgi:hypothetical protein
MAPIMSAQRGPLWSAEGEHQAGTYGGYTSRRRPVRLVWHQEFQQITDAIAVERQLKGWGRAKKEALIRGEWEMVRKLSTGRGGPGSQRMKMLDRAFFRLSFEAPWRAHLRMRRKD